MAELAAVLGDIRVEEARKADWWTSDEDHALLIRVLRGECRVWAEGLLRSDWLARRDAERDREGVGAHIAAMADDLAAKYGAGSPVEKALGPQQVSIDHLVSMLRAILAGKSHGEAAVTPQWDVNAWLVERDRARDAEARRVVEAVRALADQWERENVWLASDEPLPGGGYRSRNRMAWEVLREALAEIEEGSP